MSSERLDTPVLDAEEPITNGAESHTDAEAAAAPQPSAPQARPQEAVVLDENSALACYANFCRVSSTPEELILDFGLNPNPMAAAGTTVKVSQRIILNHYTAKRLQSALSMALRRHEQAFGVLETDVRRRVRRV